MLFLTDNSGKYIYINGLTHKYVNAGCEAEILINTIENSDKIVARIYEVVRFIDGIPVFWEEHLDRLNNSLLAYLDSDQVELEFLRRECCNLVKKCELFNCNVQVTFYIDDQQSVNIVIYVKKYFYPTQEMYENGVDTDVVHINRDNPEIKNWVPEYKAAVKAAMGENFEILLTNDNDEILEGSRSNFFYIKDGKVYTSPKNLVLNGITRINVLRAIEKCGFEIVEKSLSISEIGNTDGAFLSGTSLNVLPIRKIGSVIIFNDKRLPEMVEKIMLSFENILNAYVEENRI